MTQAELLLLLRRCAAAIAAAREWVPATAPEMVPINAADAEIQRQMACVQIPTTMSGGRDHD